MCAPAHVLMCLYPIDKSLVCLQEGRHVRIYVFPISTTYEGTYSDDFVTVFYTLVLYIRFTLSRLVTEIVGFFRVLRFPPAIKLTNTI